MGQKEVGGAVRNNTHTCVWVRGGSTNSKNSWPDAVIDRLRYCAVSTGVFLMLKKRRNSYLWSSRN